MSREPASIEQTQALLEQANYVADRALSTTLYLALKMQRPLFLEGEAGVGKTEIAKVLSQTLDRRLVRLQCYEGLDIGSAVYEWNYSRQMLEIRLAEAAGSVDKARLARDVFSEEFLIERPCCRRFARMIGERRFCSLMSSTGQMNRSRLSCWSCCPKTRFRFLKSVQCGDGTPAGDYHLQSHPGNSRCPQATMPVSLGRLPGG